MTQFDLIMKTLNNKINNAVENTCNRLLGALQQIIDEEFYDVFDPDFYVRTYQFWSSAVTEMIHQNYGEIFMDETKMNYNSYWTGKRQLLEASIGSHGGLVTNETKKHRFWDVFIHYCENNVYKIFREELIKTSIPLK